MPGSLPPGTVPAMRSRPPHTGHRPRNSARCCRAAAASAAAEASRAAASAAAARFASARVRSCPARQSEQSPPPTRWNHDNDLPHCVQAATERPPADLPPPTAVRFDPALKGVSDRPVAAGKAKMAAVGAGTRKLVVVGYGVFRNRAPFDPARGSRIAT